MKRVFSVIRTMAVALAVVMGISASAQYQRVPDPGVLPLGHAKTLTPTQTNFLDFVSSIRGHQSSQIEAAYGTAQPAMGMRPEKILRSAWEPQGNLYAVVSSIATMSTYEGAHYGKLNYNTGTVTPMYMGSVFASQLVSNLQTGFVRDGILYIPDFSQNMVTQEFYIFWKRYDIEHGKRLDDIIYGDSQDAMRMFCYGMTYDEVNDRVFILSYDITNEMGGGLSVIDCSSDDPQTWKATPLQNVGGTQNDWMAMICYVPTTQTLYGLKSSGVLYDIDTKTGRPVPCMEYDRDMNTSCFPTFMDSCYGVYSPKDKAIIVSSPDNDVQNYVIMGIDIETLEAYEICQMNVVTWVPTLYCPDPWALDEAPAEVKINSIDFDKSSVSGTFNLTTPSTYYNGIAIEGDLTIHILVDKEEVFTKTVKPGETVDCPVTTTQGLHHFTVYCSLGNMDGAAITKKMYIGHDAPQCPTNVKYANGVLTWKAPSSVGANYGYLDLSNATYDVYLNGKKVNDAPISGTSYEVVFDGPSNIRSSIQVAATANGVTGALSEPLTRVIGKGLEVPVTLAPTRAESDLFELVNNSKAAMNYYEKVNADEPVPHFDIFTSEYANQPNDWIFLPPVYFDSKTDIYNFVCQYRNHSRNNLHKDNLDIWIGKDPSQKGMTKKIYSHSSHVQTTWTDVSTNFIVDEPGTYYIGIHCAPYDSSRNEEDNSTNRYRGIRIGNFRVAKGGGSSAAPGEVTDVKLIPADFGDLSITVNATLPTLAMDELPLPADSELTLTARTDSGSASVTGKPGEKISIVVPIDFDGFNDVFISVENANGKGMERMYSVYAGIDTPLAPANVKSHVSADNLSLDLSWDPVPNIGFNGGYVDTSAVNYDIYQNNTTTTTKVGTAGKKTSYTYNGPANAQYQIRIGPVAVNEIGTSQNGIWANETLGLLYDTPMKEEWGTGGYFNYQKWLYATTDQFTNVQWGHCTSPDAEIGWNISLGNGGAMQANNVGGNNSWGELRAPRVTTKELDHVKAILRYWNYANAGYMELWGQTYDSQEFVKLAECTPSRNPKGEWVDWDINLPDTYAHQPWIQLNVRCRLNSGESVVLDSYQIIQNVETDLQVSSVTGPYSAFIGEEPEFNVVVTNNGLERAKGHLVVELHGNGDVLESQEFDIDYLASGADTEIPVTFTMLESYAKYEFTDVQAIVTCEGDENPRNNDEYCEFILNDHTIPIVRDLKAERADNGQDVNLSWSEPNREHKGLESFEISSSFGISKQIGRWKNIDMDGCKPFVVNGKSWADDDQPCAWTVINAEDLNTMDDPRFSPHSGQQMLMARSLQYLQEVDQASGSTLEYPIRNLDFLVSPHVKGGSHVSFWMNCIDAAYTETIAIWYSTTGDKVGDEPLPLEDLRSKDSSPKECGDFKFLRNFTKSGAETWELCEFDLPEDAEYFAFVYSSFGQFAAFIDDVQFTPVEPGLVDIDSYEVLVCYPGQSPRTIKSEVKGNNWTHVTSDNRAATYYVQTNVADGDSFFTGPLSNPASVEGSGVADLEAGKFVGGGKGRVLVGGATGDLFKLFDAEGRVIVNTTISSDRQSFVVPAGVYVATLGNSNLKVIVR